MLQDYRTELLDWGMDWKNLIVPGSLGYLKAIDERESDCHKWILDNMHDTQYLVGEGPGRFFNSFEFRRAYIKRYGFVLPMRELIDTIKKYSPNGVLDFGCGTSYLSFLLHTNSVKVASIDQYPPIDGNNIYSIGARHWFHVVQGSYDWVTFFSRYSLLLSWPGMDDMAAKALDVYRGDTVFYIGEGRGGCTGDDAFHDEISSKRWEQVEEDIGISFYSVHDRLNVYKRRS